MEDGPSEAPRRHLGQPRRLPSILTTVRNQVRDVAGVAPLETTQVRDVAGVAGNRNVASVAPDEQSD
jgi:hypothetical protein